jgi:hypothetical protein
MFSKFFSLLELSFASLIPINKVLLYHIYAVFSTSRRVVSI